MNYYPRGTKVEIFSGSNIGDLQELVNEFIKDKSFIADIQMSSCNSLTDIMVIYIEECD